MKIKKTRLSWRLRCKLLFSGAVYFAVAKHQDDEDDDLLYLVMGATPKDVMRHVEELSA